MSIVSPPLRRFFYVCLVAVLLALGCRAVNAEPIGADAVIREFRTTAVPCRRCIVKPHAQPSGNSEDLIAVAMRYLGSRNPTGKRGPWCGHFLNLVLRQAGYRTMPSGLARDALKLGPRIAHAVPGSVVMRPHHTELALGDGRSISGNWGGIVAIHPTSRGVVIQPSRG